MRKFGLSLLFLIMLGVTVCSADMEIDVDTSVNGTDAIVDVCFYGSYPQSGNVKAEIISSNDYLMTGLYFWGGGKIRANHEYGLEEHKGFLLKKVGIIDHNRKYLIKLRIDTKEKTVEFYVDNIFYRKAELKAGGPIKKIRYSEGYFDNFQVSNYLNVEFKKDGQSIKNIYDTGEVKAILQGEIPQGTTLIAASYKDGALNKICNISNGLEGFVDLQAEKDNQVKIFLWHMNNLIPIAIDNNHIAYSDFDEHTQFKEAVKQYENDADARNFDLSLRAEEIKEYLEGLPDGLNMEIYERQISDRIREINTGTNSPFYTGEIHSWYQGGTVGEKEQQFKDRLKMISTLPTGKGNEISLSSSPLTQLLLGNVDAANDILVGKTTGGFEFTNHEAYYLYFKYSDQLSSEARASLKKIIERECFNQQYGFSYLKGEQSPVNNAYNNQVYDGIVRGIMYAQAFDDNEILRKMEDSLDKIIVNVALSGFASADYNSPSYEAMIWADLITLKDLVTDQSILKKVDLLLTRLELEAAMRYHAPTATMTGPYARTTDDCNYLLNVRHNYQSMLYRLSDGYSYYNLTESTGTAFYLANLIAFDHKLPPYTSQVFFNKQFPYSITNLGYKNATPNYYNTDPGLQDLSKSSQYKMYTVESYATDNYSLGSTPETCWYTGGYRGQDATLIARWKRAERVISDANFGTLYSYYKYNINSNIPRIEKDNLYEEHGLSASVQHKNKAIVYSYPGKVKDERLSKAIVNDVPVLGNIEDMGTSIFLGNPNEIEEIWHGDRFIVGEILLAQNYQRELRLRITNGQLPYSFDDNAPFFIKDKDVYISIKPLGIRNVQDGTSIKGQLREHSNQQSARTNFSVPSYTINLYNYKGSKKAFSFEERSGMRNGYILEMGNKQEYGDFSSFIHHISAATTTESQDGPIWKTEYTSGNDKIKLEFDTENLLVKERTINNDNLTDVIFSVNDTQTGEKIYTTSNKQKYYDWKNYYPYTEIKETFRTQHMVQSGDSTITLGDLTLDNPDNAIVYFFYEPNTNTCIIGNLTPGESDFTITTPKESRNVENLGMEVLIIDDLDV